MNQQIHIILPDTKDCPDAVSLKNRIAEILGEEFAGKPFDLVFHLGDSAYEQAKNPLFMREAPVYDRGDSK